MGTTSPNDSHPPAPEAIAVVNGAQAETHDIAEQLRDLWVRIQADNVSLKYRDMFYEVACMAHQLSGMLDALSTVVTAAGRYHSLRNTTPLAVDWHEVPIVPDPPALPPESAL